MTHWLDLLTAIVIAGAALLPAALLALYIKDVP